MNKIYLKVVLFFFVTLTYSKSKEKKYFLLENEEVRILERREKRWYSCNSHICEWTPRINRDTIFKHKPRPARTNLINMRVTLETSKKLFAIEYQEHTMVSSYSGHVTLFLISSWPLGRNLFEYRRARFRATRR